MQKINLLIIERFAGLWDCRDKRILEVGSRIVEASQGAMQTRIRDLFPSARYLGVDASPGHGVDQVEDIHALTFSDASFELVICLDTLEHVRDPVQAMRELKRILAPSGVLLLATVMNFEIHCYPCDYWRFTPQLLAEFGQDLGMFFIAYFGYAHHPQNVYLVGVQPGQSMQHHAAICRSSFEYISKHAAPVAMHHKLLEIFRFIRNLPRFARLVIIQP